MKPQSSNVSKKADVEFRSNFLLKAL